MTRLTAALSLLALAACHPKTRSLREIGQDTWILTCEPHAHVEVSTIHAQQVIVACRWGAK
jgi:hypothetical protein